MNVRVILFDLDDTLFAHSDAVGIGLARHLQSCGCSVAIDAHNSAYSIWRALEEEYYGLHLRGEVGFQEQRRLRVRGFNATFGITIAGDVEADTWFEGFLHEYRQAWALYDDVLVALGNLRELITGVRFGIVTNGEKNISWEKMRALDLVDLMEHTVISGELGITKPDRRIFEHACNLFSVAPDAAVYVGDRLQIDAVAASQAGLLGVWLNRYGNGANDYEGEHAVLTIRSLADLPALLKVKTKNTMIRS